MSSFGAGGSNAHIVVEDVASPQSMTALPHLPLEAIVFSARDRGTLCQYARRVEAFLDSASGVALADVAYTFQIGRTPMDVRLAIVASSEEDLKTKLKTWVSLQEGQQVTSDPGAAELERVSDGVRETRFSARALVEGNSGKAFLAGMFLRAVIWKRPPALVLGIAIDWSLIRRSIVPRRLSLPTYPFARERCWLSPASLSASFVQTSAPNPVEFIQPPLAEKRNAFITAGNGRCRIWFQPSPRLRLALCCCWTHPMLCS